MSMVVGGILAIVALSMSLMTGADSWTCLGRGLAAFLVGHVSASVFWAVLGPVKTKPDVVSEPEPESQEVEVRKAA